MQTVHFISLELKQLYRKRSYLGLMLVLILMMSLAAWNTYVYTKDKAQQVQAQVQIVEENDAQLIADIDALNEGSNEFEGSYTLPTSGIRLTYNNHRLAWLPNQPLSMIAIGQGDLFSNYKKIVLYYNNSYERSSEELVSPLEQLFGQLDMAFVWVYLLPLIILLLSFDVLSSERESGRLSLINSQPISLVSWVFKKIAVRFMTMFLLLKSSTVLLLLLFGSDLASNLFMLSHLSLLLFLYCGFWFLLSFLVNLAGYSSGKNLIILTNIWVVFVFLLPSAVNLFAKELNPIPSRLEIVSHHQSMYNEMENDFHREMEKLYFKHPDWKSNDPVTKDMSHSTGWNINYLAKQYIAQLKHKAVLEQYEEYVEQRNNWVELFKFLSPSMVIQSALTHMAGTSANYYGSYLKQTQEYADRYRKYVFKRVFTNHKFSSDEIRTLPAFNFDKSRVNHSFVLDTFILFIFLFAELLICSCVIKRIFKNHQVH
jgi:ABC-2 type transport system permease protein